MTPDERALNLRAELAALGVPAEHIAFRLLDRRDPLTGSVDLLCMEAVDTILAFRDHATVCSTLVTQAEDENTRLRAAIATALCEINEITIRLEMIIGPMRKAVEND